MKPEVNLLEDHVCGLDCKCGANVKLGFKSDKEYDKFLQFLEKNYEIKDLRR